jgi:hypothetical protein
MWAGGAAAILVCSDSDENVGFRLAFGGLRR